MKRTLLSSLAVAALLCLAPWVGLARPAQAADAAKPVAVVTLSGYDSLMADVNFLGSLANQPGASQQLEGLIALFTQGQGLKGLDRTRPVGFVLNTDGMSFQPLIFLPTDNVKNLLGALSGALGEAKDAGDSMFEVQAGPQKVYVKQSGNWAFIGQTTESLADLPADPLKSVGTLTSKYDLAARIHVQNIPELYRSLALDQIKEGAKAGLERRQDDSDADFELRESMLKRQLAQFEQLFNEANEITLGVNVDSQGKSIRIEGGVTAVAGSKMAKQLAASVATKSSLGGFFDAQAAFSLAAAATIQKEDIPQVVQQLNLAKGQAMKEIENSHDLPNDDAKKLVRGLLDQLFGAVQATVESGKMDVAGTVKVDEKSLTAVAAAYVAKPADLEAVVKKLVAEGKKHEPANFPDVKFDAETHAGVRIHTASVPVPPGEDVAKVFGDKLDVALGFGKDVACLAIGNNAVSALKAALDSSGSAKAVAPVQATLSLGSILKFAAAQSGDPGVAAMAAAAQQAGGADKVTLAAKVDASGATYTLEIQEGVLKAIAGAAAMRHAQGGGF